MPAPRAPFMDTCGVVRSSTYFSCPSPDGHAQSPASGEEAKLGRRAGKRTKPRFGYDLCLLPFCSMFGMTIEATGETERKSPTAPVFCRVDFVLGFQYIAIYLVQPPPPASRPTLKQQVGGHGLVLAARQVRLDHA